MELIADQTRYTLQACATAPNAYALLMNGTRKTVPLHRLADGGLLLTVDGATRTTYMREEIDRYRVIIDNRTFVFEKENDPSVVRSPSAGKLLNLLVEDDGHVTRGQAYAEIEVMKMVMQLCAPEAGHLTWCRRAGAVLETGAIIAHIRLDDETMVKKATPSLATFDEVTVESKPAAGRQLRAGGSDGSNMQHTFARLKQALEDNLAGYCLPVEHCDALFRQHIADFMQLLRMPLLPMLQLQDALASISNRMPAQVEADIREQLRLYQSHITSTLVQFPSQAIGAVLDAHAATIAAPAERAQFLQLTGDVVQLIQRFRHGLRGHTKLTLERIFEAFLGVEKHFQRGPYERSVATLAAAHKDDPAASVAVVFSHAQLPQKRVLMTVLMEHLQAHEPGVTQDLAAPLGELAMLSGGGSIGAGAAAGVTTASNSNSRLAVCARQTLMAAQRPLYEQRRNEMEAILLSAVDAFGHEYRPERLHRLVRLQTAIFDVLPGFFYHANAAVCQAALEVYVRRAYTLYDIVGVGYVPAQLLSSAGAHQLACVHFEFRLPRTHPKRVSAVNGRVINRAGWIVAFTSFKLFQAASRNLWTTIAMWRASRMSGGGKSSGDNGGHDDDDEPATTEDEEALHVGAFVLNVAVQNAASLADEEHARQFADFCKDNRAMFGELDIRRITFMVLCGQMLPKYFTFSVAGGFAEDRIYRHIEPASAHLLELNRMRNFDLTKLSTQNHTMHLYRGTTKASTSTSGQPDSATATSGGARPAGARAERRYFIRSLVRHPDLSTKEASLEYLDREIRLALVQAMDELDVALAHEQNASFRNNHIFLSFIAPIIATVHQLDGSVSRATREFADRLWSLRVLQIELKMRLVLTTAPHNMDAVQLVRVCVANNGKHSLKVSVYLEELNENGQQVQLVSVVLGGGMADATDGPVATTTTAAAAAGGQPLLSGNMPYIADNTLQDKRFQAQVNLTTYVYDVPEMFAQMTERLWSEFVRDRPAVVVPKRVVVRCIELVWRGGALEEVSRFPGANDVSTRL